MPVHQINVVGVATAIEHPVANEYGVQVDCIVSDYLSKDRQVEIPITLFHPSGSRFTSQTTTVKRGSIIFFSGALTLIENKFYLELHNFSFIKTSQSINSLHSKRMPWALKSSDQQSSDSPISIVKSIHDSKKKAPTPDDSSKSMKNSYISKKASFSPPALPSRFNKTVTVVDSDVEYVETTKNAEEKSSTPPRNTLTPQQEATPPSTKRKLRSSPRVDRNSKVQKSTKLSKKPANVATNVIATANLDVEYVKVAENTSTPPSEISRDISMIQQEPTSPTTKSCSRINHNNKVQKRITRSRKLADIATDIVTTADSDVEYVEEIE